MDEDQLDNVNSLTEMLLKLIDEKLGEFKKSIDNQISNIDSLRILKEKEILQLLTLIGTLQNRKLIISQQSYIDSTKQQISELKLEKKKLENKVGDLQNALAAKTEVQDQDVDEFKSIKLEYKYIIMDFGIDKFLKELMVKIKTTSEVYNQLVVLKFRKNKITRDMTNGIISRMESQREENVLATTCVNLIDTLRRDDFISE